MFVVVGATGNTGGSVVETLLSQKQAVRVLVRSAEKGAGWKAKGAEVAVASLDDVLALTKAFEGARGVYLMVPPNYGATAWLSDQQLLPRLTTEDSGLSRLTGGIGGRGPGETKLESDRRKARDRIHRLGKQLEKYQSGADSSPKQKDPERSAHRFHCRVHQCGEIHPFERLDPQPG